MNRCGRRVPQRYHALVPRYLMLLLLAMLAGLGPQSVPEAIPTSRFFAASQLTSQRAFERELNAIADPQRLRGWHDMLASEPHIAGTEADQRLIDAIAAACRDMGLEVQVHEFWGLLCEPIDAKLEIVGGEDAGMIATSQPNAPSTRRGVVTLPLTEDNLLSDPFIAHPGLTFGWNAYSGSGDVTAGVVYANFGTKEDFETLKKLGVGCTGKIVLARYGGNYRGFKVKFAEQAGAAGLIIYTDPDDSGYRKGVPYPEGGWANDTCIQRGSINTLDQPGDPLTPGVAATQEATRLDPDEVGLPRIPVQPIGYRAAQQIMQRMTGRALPEELVKAWQGGLPVAYRLTGGEELRLRLMVRQERTIKRSASVIATLRGASASLRTVYVGSHHDAWGFGAGDPAAGGIVVLEAARSFAEMTRRGVRPLRSIAFCFWGAEEFGIIGSSEYCEQHADALRRDAVAYINLDGAAMGPNFSASSDPMLKTVIEESAREVPQARDATKTVFDAWKADKPVPPFGDLGGGSDHVGFYCHLGIPSCFLSSQGTPGTAYHSNYDNLAWYRRTVGEDYAPALMLTRLVNVLVARLANVPVEPLEPARYAADLRTHLNAITELAQARNLAATLTPLVAALVRLEAMSARAAKSETFSVAGSDADATTIARRNAVIADLCKLWQPRWPEGLPGRPWFRNFYASSDPNSGYSAWVLPALRAAIESGDPPSVEAAVTIYARTLDRLTEAIGSLLEAPAASMRPEAAQ